VIDRIINFVLQISLLLASVGSLLSLMKMVIEHFAPIGYYWWAAVAFFGATFALAGAIRVRDDRAAMRIERERAT
jgi:hypothetical protein